MTINNTYTLPTASSSILGGIKVGSGLSIDTNGVLSTAFNIPMASPTLLGGVKVGTGLSIDPTGVLSTILPVASSIGLGGIKVGSGLSIDGAGVLSTTTTGGIAWTTIPSVKAYSIVAHTIAGNGFINLPFENTDHDQGTTSAQHSTTVNPERLTCQQAGIYQVNGTVKIVLNSTVTAGHLEFYLQRYNSSGTQLDIIAAEHVTVIGGITQSIAVNLSGQAQLGVGDYVDLEIDSTVSQAITTSYASAGTQFPSISWSRVA